MWQGILQEKDIDELAPGVYIGVKPMNFEVGNGAHVRVDAAYEDALRRL